MIGVIGDLKWSKRVADSIPEYNQIMKVIRQQFVLEKRRKQAQCKQIINISDDEIQIMSLPRKIVKKSTKCSKNSQSLQYSKIPSIPEIKLTKEDMKKDPIQLLVDLQKKYQQFGGVKLSAPPEWKPPFCFTYGQIGIKTRVQHLHKLKFGKSFKEKQQAYNVRNFQMMAQDFQKEYRFKTNPAGSEKQEKVQSEYWNLVNGKYVGLEWKFKTTVEYAADLPVKKHGSGFPLCQSIRSKDDNFDYFSNMFNLNNIYKSNLSILKIADEKKQFISGVTSPWVYMGMMFSTFCWHVEDLWLNSVNYNHKGSTKTWYIIPRKYKQKFDSYVKMKTERQDLLDRITYMLDPLEIMRNGIPIYKANQRPGDYVCTFFKAYHAGFSHGFNIGQAVNFASPLSLDYIQQSMNYLVQNKQKKPAVLSYQWLVYQNYLNSKWKNHENLQKIINQEYERIIKQEYDWIKEVSQKYPLSLGQQIGVNCKYDKNSCSKCRNYQYLSSIRCSECKRNYCRDDFHNCCGAPFQLVHRQFNADRKKIGTLLTKNKK